jgi:hypothetical protein
VQIYFTAMPHPYRCCLVRRKHLLAPPPCSPRSPFFFKDETASVELQLPCSSSGNNSDDDFVPVFPILPVGPPKKGWAMEKENNAPEMMEGDLDGDEEDLNGPIKLLEPNSMLKKRNNSIRKNGIISTPQQNAQTQQLIGNMNEDGTKKGRN